MTPQSHCHAQGPVCRRINPQEEGKGIPSRRVHALLMWDPIKALMVNTNYRVFIGG